MIAVVDDETGAVLFLVDDPTPYLTEGRSSREAVEADWPPPPPVVLTAAGSFARLTSSEQVNVVCSDHVAVKQHLSLTVATDRVVIGSVEDLLAMSQISNLGLLDGEGRLEAILANEPPPAS